MIPRSRRLVFEMTAQDWADRDEKARKRDLDIAVQEVPFYEQKIWDAAARGHAIGPLRDMGYNPIPHNMLFSYVPIHWAYLPTHGDTRTILQRKWPLYTTQMAPLGQVRKLTDWTRWPSSSYNHPYPVLLRVVHEPPGAFGQQIASRNESFNVAQ